MIHKTESRGVRMVHYYFGEELKWTNFVEDILQWDVWEFNRKEEKEKEVVMK